MDFSSFSTEALVESSNALKRTLDTFEGFCRAFHPKEDERGREILKDQMTFQWLSVEVALKERRRSGSR